MNGCDAADLKAIRAKGRYLSSYEARRLKECRNGGIWWSGWYGPVWGLGNINPVSTAVSPNLQSKAMSAAHYKILKSKRRKPANAESVAKAMKFAKSTKAEVLRLNPNVYVARISKGSKLARQALNNQFARFAGMSGSWIIFDTALGQVKAQVTAKNLYL